VRENGSANLRYVGRQSPKGCFLKAPEGTRCQSTDDRFPDRSGAAATEHVPTQMNPATIARPEKPTRAKRGATTAKVTCDDCFFKQNDLCALDRDKPCPTFRAAADGLKSPQQLTFAFRQERPRSAWVFQQPV
jgi:hypothetical protein